MSEITYQQAVEQIKNTLDIVEVISRYVVLKKAGRNYQGLCPFHGEKTPSFVVTPDKQIFKCFGCGEGGDVFTFLMKINNQSFTEVVEEQAASLGIELPKRSLKNIQEHKHEKERLIDAMEQAQTFFKQNLLNNSKALEYLEKRGINKDAIDKFSLGLAPKGNFELKNYLTNLGFTVDELSKAGLVYEKEGTFLDRFKNRIMIPIKDVNSNTIAFGARAILDGQIPKYINSSESSIYNKSSVLFGLNYAKDAITKSDSIIFMEGYFDVISAHLGGVENAVATCGTALTTQHIKLISRYSPSRRIYLAFDTDNAGKKAIEHGALVIKNIFSALGNIKQYDSNFQNQTQDNVCEIRVVQEIQGKDPDEFIREFGAEEYLRRIQKAPLLLDYQLNQVYSDIKGKLTPQEKSAYVIQIADILYQIKNPVILDDYLKEASFKLDVAQNILKTQILSKQQDEFGILKIENDNLIDRKVFSKNSDNQCELMEENIIKLAFVADTTEKISYFKQKLSLYECQNEDNKNILESIDKELAKVNNVDELAKKVFLGFYNEQHIQKKISDNIFSSREFTNLSQEDYKKALDEAFLRLNEIKTKNKRDELKKMLKNDTLSEQEKQEIFQQIFKN